MFARLLGLSCLLGLSVADARVPKIFTTTADWNAVHLVIRGNVLMHFLNGRAMTVVTDDDRANRPAEGLLGMQVHVGPPMKVEYRNIRLKTW